MTSRRDFLKYALSVGAMGSSGVLPASIRRAFAIEPELNSSFLDAEHIVFLMQENRSFDHMFGTLQGVRGFNDRRIITQSNGNPVFAQSGKNGETFLPWRLNIRDTRATWLGSIPHNRHSQVDAWNQGHHDHWIDAKRPAHKEYAQYPFTMGYYNREDLPFYYALADAFTICDQYYCGGMTSTTPNRLLFWTGTVRDKQSTHSNIYMRNAEIVDGGMNWHTFPEHLEKVGVSWKFYQNEITQTSGINAEERAWLANFGCNVLEFFEQYNVSAHPGFSGWKKSHLKTLSNPAKPSDEVEIQRRLEFFKHLCDSPHVMLDDMTAEQKSLHERAFVTNTGDPNYHTLEQVNVGNNGHMKAPKGDILYQFRKDVQSGQLPTVSWLAAPEHFSDHPTSPWYGAWYVSEVLDILTSDPDVWKKTILIINYDENDGYFDHCCSYAAPDPRRPETGKSSSSIGKDGLEYTYREDELSRGVQEKFARSGPIGLGYRVPMFVASPWSRGGWVNSQLFEHTSALQFLERFIEGKFGKHITETNISPWRRAISGNLISCFRPFDGKPVQLPLVNRLAHLEMIHDAREKPMPGGFRSLDKETVALFRHQPQQLYQQLSQEKGTRPSCALPYELHCEGGLSPNGDMIQLSFKSDTHLFGRSAKGAPFNLYCHYGPGNMQAGTYAVAAGDTLKHHIDLQEFEGDDYDVTIHAPNGFYRRFKGHNKNGVALKVQTKYGDQHSPILTLLLINNDQQPLNLTLIREMTKQATQIQLLPSSTKGIEIDLSGTDRWYHLRLICAEEPILSYELSGHMESGKASRTDPLMGKA